MKTVGEAHSLFFNEDLLYIGRLTDLSLGGMEIEARRRLALITHRHYRQLGEKCVSYTTTLWVLC